MLLLGESIFLEGKRGRGFNDFLFFIFLWDGNGMGFMRARKRACVLVMVSRGHSNGNGNDLSNERAVGGGYHIMTFPFLPFFFISSQTK